MLSQINYGILMWGYHSGRLYKLQKIAMRIINFAPYNAQFRPLIALRTDLSHITTELWEIQVLRMAH